MQIGNQRLRRKELCSLLAGVGLVTHQVCQKAVGFACAAPTAEDTARESGALRKERPDGHSLLASGYWWRAGSEEAANSACASFAAIGVEPLYVFGNGSSITMP